MRGDASDRFGTQRLAVSVAERHLPLGDVLVVAEAWFHGLDVGVGAFAKRRRRKLGALGYRVEPFGNLPPAFVGPLSRSRQWHSRV